MPTIAEIAQGRNIPLTSGVMMAVQTKAPLFSAFSARTSTSTKFQTLAVTGLPSSGFVDLNEGFTMSAGTLALREFDCSLIGGLIKEEVISANKWNETHPGIGYTYFDLQTQLKMKADIRHIEKQMIYGSSNDAKGFPGMKTLTPYSNVLSLTSNPEDYDYARSVINAGGSTATTASSVYSIVFGEIDGAQLVFGNDGGGELLEMSEIIQQTMAPDPSDTTKVSLHNVAQVHGWVGLSVGGMNQTPNSVVPTQYAIRRLANVTRDSGCGVTDAKLEALVLSHGDSETPSILAMSPRGGTQLAASRSATSVTVMLGGMSNAKASEANLQAARPTNYNGIPIVYTSLILNTDAIEA